MQRAPEYVLSYFGDMDSLGRCCKARRCNRCLELEDRTASDSLVPNCGTSCCQQHQPNRQNCANDMSLGDQGKLLTIISERLDETVQLNEACKVPARRFTPALPCRIHTVSQCHSGSLSCSPFPSHPASAAPRLLRGSPAPPLPHRLRAPHRQVQRHERLLLPRGARLPRPPQALRARPPPHPHLLPAPPPRRRHARHQVPRGPGPAKQVVVRAASPPTPRSRSPTGPAAPAARMETNCHSLTRAP
jgi:hypothetical protein